VKSPLPEAIRSLEQRSAAYVLLGSDGKYLYKGACRNLPERLKSHHAGNCPRTRNRRPLSLFYFEYCDTYEAALKKERYLKSGHGRAWLKRRMSSNSG